MAIPTPESLRRIHRRQDRQAEQKRQRQARAQRVLEKLKNGAVLCRHHQRGRTVWCLVWKGGSEFVTHELVTDALATGHVVGVGDAFEGAPSQTYQYVEEVAR
jgi:DNA-binding transcriptional MocR family regulator